MSSILERSLKLYLLPGKPPADFRFRKLHDDAYTLWKDTWAKTLHDMDGNELNVDHFLRQDIIAVIAHGDTVVGVHLYTCFDLSLLAHREHSYFTQHYTPRALESLLASGARRVMSLEYLAVHSDWRASLTGISMPAVLVTNGIRLGFSLGAEAIVGVARIARGIDKVCTDHGALVLDTRQNLHHEDFSVICFLPDETRDYPKQPEHHLADKLWANRIDATEIAVSTPGKKAA